MGDVLLFALSRDGREIRVRAGEAVSAGHNNHVCGSCKVDQGPKFCPTLGGRAACQGNSLSRAESAEPVESVLAEISAIAW